MTGDKRILALVTDAYGGMGGTAAYARDALAAMVTHPAIGQVIVLPRIITHSVVDVPREVVFETGASASVARYIAHFGSRVARGGYDAVWASHIHLAPLALLAARRARVPWGLTLHGVEGWSRSKRLGASAAAERANLLMPVSALTLRRFRATHPSASGVEAILPGGVDLDQFMPGARSAALAERLGLTGRRVIMTLGRLDANERAKGFDRVIETLPALVRDVPDIAYLICGSGPDRQRLETLARDLGVRDRVIFAGSIQEAEKPDHYRLADAFILPSVMEGLGLVLLEAMACGVPTVASSVDGGAEAVGDRGWTVDPSEPRQIEAAIRAALSASPVRPRGLNHFARPQGQIRMRAALDLLLRHPKEA